MSTIIFKELFFVFMFQKSRTKFHKASRQIPPHQRYLLQMCDSTGFVLLHTTVLRQTVSDRESLRAGICLCYKHDKFKVNELLRAR